MSAIVVRPELLKYLVSSVHLIFSILLGAQTFIEIYIVHPYIRHHLVAQSEDLVTYASDLFAL